MFGLGAAVVGLLAGVGFYVGMPYFFYGILRMRLASVYRAKVNADPWPIFRSGWISSTVWMVVWVAAFFLMAFSSFIVLLLIVLLVLGGGGTLWLLIDFIRHFFGSQNPKAYWKRHPPPRLQFGMIDLYTGILVYGITMAVFAAPAQYSQMNSDQVVLLAIGFLLGEGLAFYVALDVLRRTERLKRPAHRALFIGLLMAYSSMFWLLTWMVFRAWRFTMRIQGEEREALDQLREQQASMLPSNFPPLPPYPEEPVQPS